MPKEIWIPLGLLGGLVFILILNPLHTVCHSQLEELQRHHTPFFIFESSAKFKEKTEYQQAFEYCQDTNSLGGCTKLFTGINELMNTLTAIPSECVSSLCKRKEFNTPLWETADLLVRIAWGEAPSQDIYERTRWLNYSHLSLFCKLKKLLISCDGDSKWKQAQTEILNDLPGTEEMDVSEIRKITLFSINCDQVL